MMTTAKVKTVRRRKNTRAESQIYPWRNLKVKPYKTRRAASATKKASFLPRTRRLKNPVNVRSHLRSKKTQQM
jgi:hypothetical protein